MAQRDRLQLYRDLCKLEGSMQFCMALNVVAVVGLFFVWTGDRQHTEAMLWATIAFTLLYLVARSLRDGSRARSFKLYQQLQEGQRGKKTN